MSPGPGEGGGGEASGRSQEKPSGRSQGDPSGRSQGEVTPWEENYELLLCEGLFSEYLEMGQFLHSPGPSLDLLQLLVSWINFHLVSSNSDPIWLHYHLCGGLPSGAALCSHQQLGGDPTGRSEVCG